MDEQLTCTAADGVALLSVDFVRTSAIGQGIAAVAFLGAGGWVR